MIIMTAVRRMGDVARDALLDEILGDKVAELRMSRDANLGAASAPTSAVLSSTT